MSENLPALIHRWEMMEGYEAYEAYEASEKAKEVREMKIEKFPELDKSKWGDGPWQDEPDKAYWIDFKTGFDCLIVRNPMGALCGYVGIKPDHKYYGKSYHDVPVYVHGGLTYSDHCQKGGHVCHKTDDQNDKTWWVGFDCAHSGDSVPSMNMYLKESNPLFVNKSIFPKDEYRTFQYVQNEVTNLAMQLKSGALKADES